MQNNNTSKLKNPRFKHSNNDQDPDPDLGSWILDLGSWILDLGSWIRIPQAVRAAIAKMWLVYGFWTFCSRRGRIRHHFRRSRGLWYCFFTAHRSETVPRLETCLFTQLRGSRKDNQGHCGLLGSVRGQFGVSLGSSREHREGIQSHQGAAGRHSKISKFPNSQFKIPICKTTTLQN